MTSNSTPCAGQTGSSSNITKKIYLTKNMTKQQQKFGFCCGLFLRIAYMIDLLILICTLFHDIFDLWILT